MATQNADTRKSQLETMRQGTPLYQQDKDIVRGLLTDLRSQEALIVVGTTQPDMVNLRMGDVSYSRTSV